MMTSTRLLPNRLCVANKMGWTLIMSTMLSSIKRVYETSMVVILTIMIIVFEKNATAKKLMRKGRRLLLVIKYRDTNIYHLQRIFVVQIPEEGVFFFAARLLVATACSTSKVTFSLVSFLSFYFFLSNITLVFLCS